MPAFVPNGPVTADDPVYQEALAAEAAFWADPGVYPIADVLASITTGPVREHHNRRLTGRANDDWHTVIGEFGPFQRGLILGCGSIVEEQRILASLPDVAFELIDIDEEGLKRRRAAFGEPGSSGRVTCRVADLNFATFTANSYDVIISASTVHHIVNLEELAQSINEGLTNDGFFFLHDHTGASGFRFPERQKGIFEAICARERLRTGNSSFPVAAWKDVDNHDFSPFEAVRSADTVRVFGEHLSEVRRRHTGTILSLMLFSDLVRDLDTSAIIARERKRRRDSEALPNIWELTLSAECIGELCLFDDVVTDAELFPPMTTFAVYRKKR